MDGIVNIQLAVFCDKHIEPTPERITDIMGKLNGIQGSNMVFLPSVFNGQIFNGLNNQTVTVQNISFSTSDQRCKITYNDYRIDVVMNVNDESFWAYPQDVMLAEKILRVVMSNDSIVGNRLALQLFMINGKNIEDTNPVVNKLTTLLGYYQGKPVKEFSNSCNIRQKIILCEKEEELNVITGLSITQNDLSKQQRVLCHIDINTIPENNGLRFNAESVHGFVEAVKPIVDSISGDFERLDLNE